MDITPPNQFQQLNWKEIFALSGDENNVAPS